MKTMIAGLMSVWVMAAVYTAQTPVEATELIQPRIDTEVRAENVWATITDVPDRQTKLTIDPGDRCLITVMFTPNDEIKPVIDEVEPETVPEPVPEPVVAAPQPAPATGKHLWGVCTITHYCWCAQCCGRAGHPTASGVNPTVNHTVACGALPFGTRLEINGQQYVVEDTGVNGFWVDIFVGSHEEANARGMFQAEVYILE